MSSRTRIENDAIMLNPLGIGHKRIRAAVELRPHIGLQEAQVHWLDDVIQIIRHFDKIHGLAERFRLRRKYNIIYTK